MPSQTSYVLSLDGGTTGATAFILSLNGKSQEILASVTIDFKQHYPKNNWVEHDLNQIWEAFQRAILRAVSEAKTKDSNFDLKKLSCLGLTNQRETLCLFSAKDSAPLSKAIVWQCKRSYSICKDLKSQGLEPVIKEKTGLLLDPYFTGTKLKWLLDNKPELKEQIINGKALLGTIDTFLLHKLTGGSSYYTEPSNASRTLLYNIKEKKWDTELLDIMGGLKPKNLPEVRDSNSLFGKTKGNLVLPDGIDITGILGDQQASLFGHTCFNYGESKCTYGTGTFFLMNTGDKIVSSNQGLLSTIAYQINGKVSYALEGSCFIAGAAVGFLRDNLKLIDKAKDTGNIPKSTKASPNIYFVPALSGLGAPYWEPSAKGALLGLTRSSSKEEIIKACLEGICFQVEDLLDVFRKEASITLDKLFVDGGATSNEILMTDQAYISNLEVIRPKIIEATAYGAAAIAAYGKGLISSLEELKEQKTYDRSFKAKLSDHEADLRELKLRNWKKAIEAVKIFS